MKYFKFYKSSRVFNISVIIIFFIGLQACKSEQKDFELAVTSPGSTYYDVGITLSEVLAQESSFRLETLHADTLSTISNCNMLQSREADLAIAQNDTPTELILKNAVKGDAKIRSLFPIYSEILFIIKPDSIESGTLKELITGRRIGMGPEESGTAKFLKELFNKFGIIEGSYTPVFTTFSENVLTNPIIDISCAVTGFNNERIFDMLENQSGEIFSLGDYTLLNHGSVVDGFCMKYPRSEPFIIPKNIFSSHPKNPVLTISIKSVLLTHSGMDDDDIYSLVETIFGNKQTLANKNPLFNELTSTFDPSNLNFPLHPGMVMYMERNKPSFFERYAESFGVVFSIMVVLFGALRTFQGSLSQRKKDRIDDYYTLIIEIEESIVGVTDVQLLKKKIINIREIKKTAFGLLVAEKVAADESFRIFIALANDTIALIEIQIKKIKG
jgi:TRAP transporter TAXI family solute receptor